MELLDDEHQIITQPGVSGEITGTGYFNRVMPLIRYRTADYGTLDQPGPCPYCGRMHQRLATIEGRLQEYLILKDGTRFPATNINAIHGLFFSYMYRFQFIQNQPGKAVLRFIPAVEITPERMAEIKAAFAYMKDIGLDCEIKVTDQIPLTRGGKERIVIKSEEVGS
jgi:phenylacetate-CoA ligase